MRLFGRKRRDNEVEERCPHCGEPLPGQATQLDVRSRSAAARRSAKQPGGRLCQDRFRAARPGGGTMRPPIVLAFGRRTWEHVARAGGQVGRDFGARVALVHVRADRPLVRSRRERERDQEILQRVRDVLPMAVEADERVELAMPVARLPVFAEEVDAALLVVGTPGRRRISSALLGRATQTPAGRGRCGLRPTAPPGRRSVGGSGSRSRPDQVQARS